jgi:superfamily II DNA or RNA helicase
MSEDIKNFILNLKSTYHSGHGDHLAKDFYNPCLSRCTSFIRETSDFTSNVIFQWGSALKDIIEKEDKDTIIKIIAEPKLHEDDKKILKEVLDKKKDDEYLDQISDNIIENAFKLVNQKNDYEIKLKIFAYLISTKKLILKFAFPHHVSDSGLFHSKVGLYEFGKYKVAFNGGSNETFGGYHKNIESIWVDNNVNGDNGRVTGTENQLYEAWNDKAKGFRTKKLSQKTLDRIISYAPSKSKIKEYIKTFKEQFTDPLSETLDEDVKNNFINTHQDKKENYLDVLEKKWIFQEKARKVFIEKKYGLLEMATGTGKTRTALSIVTELLKEEKINKIIIQMEGNDLLKQWKKNIKEWINSETYKDVNLLLYTNEKNELNDFLYNFKNDTADLILVSQHNLPNLLDQINQNNLSKTIIIHDEVHGLFTPATKEKIFGKQSKFGYRLGLSATIVDGYDEEREGILFSEVGPIIYSYTLKQAIEDGVLVEFDLIDFTYKLTEEEKSKKKALFARFNSQLNQGVPEFIAARELSIGLADVNKNALNKIEVFEENFDKIKPHLQRSFIFADESIYIDQVMEKLIYHNINVKKHVGSANYDNITAFSKGEIDCLLNCEKLSQGIDVKSVNNIILFATPKGRQLIQRLGRVLRSDLTNNPDKRACVIDFYEENDMQEKEGPEYDRYLKLTDWSSTRKK